RSIDVLAEHSYSSSEVRPMSENGTTVMARIAAARRRLWLAAVAAVALGAASVAAASAQDPVYAAAAQVGFGTADVPAQASAALTPAMARKAMRRAGVAGMPARDLLDHTAITVDASSGVAVVRVTDSSGPRARRLANAYAQTLVAARRRQIADGARRTKARLHRELVQADRALKTAQGSNRTLMRTQHNTLVRLWQGIDTRTSLAMDGVQVIGVAAA